MLPQLPGVSDIDNLVVVRFAGSKYGLKKRLRLAGVYAKGVVTQVLPEFADTYCALLVMPICKSKQCRTVPYAHTGQQQPYPHEHCTCLVWNAI